MNENEVPNQSGPDCGDYLIAYATVPGYVAYRTDEGSIYIQNLVEEFKSNYQTMALRDMLINVNRQVSDLQFEDQKGCFKQQPSFEFALNKRVYFGHQVFHKGNKNL